MRKLIVNAFVTLERVMQAPGGPEEDSSTSMAHPFDLLLGRKTYDAVNAVKAQDGPEIQSRAAPASSSRCTPTG